MASTIYNQFLESVQHHPDNEALAILQEGSYVPITYAQLNEKILRVAASLSKQFTAGEKISLMIDNGPDWVIIDMAGAKLGLVIVPIHTTYNAEYAEYIIKHSDSVCLFTGAEYYKKLKKTLEKIKLNAIYIVDGSIDGGINTSNVMRYEDLLHEEKETESTSSNVEENDLHTIVYTSGTTGKPKGVMLSHKNIISNALAAKKHISVNPTDRFFSFLPLSHIFERTAGYYIPLFSGSAIYYSRNTKSIVDDIKIAKPTIFISVPRIFERVYEKIKIKIESKAILKSLRAKKTIGDSDRVSSTKFKAFLLRFLIGRTIRNIFGGRLRFAVSGGASLSKHIAEFFSIFNIIILEGYGLTETSPIISANKLSDYNFGTVGTSLDGVEVRLSSDGEILARGSNIMMGYYKDTEQTRQVIDQGGWFYTGDLGSIGKDKSVTITGRIKEMIVLSTGKNIAPVPIEQALEENIYIKQAMVYGDKAKYLSAIIVPDADSLMSWCKDNEFSYDISQILERGEVVRFYEDQVQIALMHFNELERPKEIKLVPETWTQEDDMLTPTLKLKRDKILHTFALP